MKDKLYDFFHNKKKVGILLVILLIILLIFIIICNNKSNITCEDAERIALEKINGSVSKCERHGKKYEVEILHDNYEYEFIINGKTGEIIEYDGDYED